MVRVQELSKRYGSVTAVDALSFEVEAGETFALIGPNGAGKTTTLRMLLGLTRPDSGRIAIGPGGMPPDRLEARRDLGYVPQRVAFPSGRTVSEVLAFFAELRGLAPAAVHAAIERVGLQALGGRRADQLSGGFAQRLSLAQALLGDPALLVLDEPTASLDPQATWEFRSLIERLQGEGKTILLCSHLLAEVERVADRVLILLEGRVAALESLGELRRRQLSATCLAINLDGDPARALAKLTAGGFSGHAQGPARLVVDAANGRSLEALAVLRAAGIEVRSFDVQRPTLEEIFLSVVTGGSRD